MNTIVQHSENPAASAHSARREVSSQSMTLRDTGPYSARNSSKGALIDEAGRVFAALAHGHSVEQVRDQALRGEILTQRSRNNRERIWTSIQQRYLVPAAPWLTASLAARCVDGPQNPEFVSLLYLLYALRDSLTFEFVTNGLWGKRHLARPVITRNDVLDHLRHTASRQPQIERWTESTRIKLAGSILTALRDFGVLEGQQKKALIRPVCPLSTAEVLLRILTAEGSRGRELLQDPAWRLFLLSEPEVASTLAKLAQQGTVRFEKAGGTVVLETPSEWEDRP